MASDLSRVMSERNNRELSQRLEKVQNHTAEDSRKHRLLVTILPAPYLLVITAIC